MLQRDIEIRDELFEFLHLVDPFQREDIRIEVEESVFNVSWQCI